MYSSYKSYRRPRRSSSSSFVIFASLMAGLVLFILLFSFVWQFWGQMKLSKQDDLVLTLLEGKANLILAGGPEQVVSLTQFVYEGDTIQSLPGSRLHLEFPGGAKLILDEQTRLRYTHFEGEEGVNRFDLDLLEGRVWLSQKISPMKAQLETIRLRAALYEVSSTQTEYLMSLGSDEDRFSVWSGEAQLRYLDPDSLQEIDALRLRAGEMTRFDLEKKALFLSRRPVNLLEAFDVQDRTSLAFIQENAPPSAVDADAGQTDADATLIEPELSVAEPVLPKPVEAKLPSLRVTNLAAKTSITKTGQAIEGVLQNPESILAVEIAWSGSGVFYPLSLYTPGTASFRYVADLQYGNLAYGSNTYRIRAKKADGTYTSEVQIMLELRKVD